MGGEGGKWGVEFWGEQGGNRGRGGAEGGLEGKMLSKKNNDVKIVQQDNRP